MFTYIDTSTSVSKMSNDFDFLSTGMGNYHACIYALFYALQCQGSIKSPILLQVVF